MEIININGELNKQIRAIEVHDHNHINFLSLFFNYQPVSYKYEERFRTLNGYISPISVTLLKSTNPKCVVDIYDVKYEYYKYLWNQNKLHITVNKNRYEICQFLINSQDWNAPYRLNHNGQYLYNLRDLKYNIYSISATNLLHIIDMYKKNNPLFKPFNLIDEIVEKIEKL